MKKPPKTPPAVAAAMAAVDMQARKIKAVEADLVQMRAELGRLHAAVTAAREAEDAHLPQCRMVRVSRYTGETEGDFHVIMRQTTGGQLVTRPFGEPGPERRWKRIEWSGTWRLVEKTSVYDATYLQLRDVPKQFEPAKEPT